SSGSSRDAISVEPTRSQNKTVRWRRSPSAEAVIGVTSGLLGRATSANPARIRHRIFRPAGWTRRILGTMQRGMSRNSCRICALRDYRLHTWGTSLSGAQLIQQGFGVLQVGGVEAFGEPFVDFAEHAARLVPAISVAQQSREAGGRAQFP